MSSLAVLRLRKSRLSFADLQALQSMWPNLQFLIIQAGMGGYANHCAQDLCPWWHLVPSYTG